MRKSLPHSFHQPVSGFLTPSFVETGGGERLVGGFFQVAVSSFGVFQLSLGFLRFERLNHLV